MTKVPCVSVLAVFCCVLTVQVKAENSQYVFATRTPIPNDQKFDIDGDGQADSAEWVTISKNTQSLPSSTTLVSPWSLDDEAETASNPLQGGSHQKLLVTLGNAKQFLIHDVNEVSLLDTDAAKETSLASKSSLVELELPELSEQTKGDVFVIPTEAGIDTYLYWDGSTFQTYEPMELP